MCLYEGVIVPTAMYGAEALGVRSAERRKVNVLEMKCLRILESHEWIELGMKSVLASRADQRVLRWFEHVERMDENRMARWVLMEGG